MVNMTIALPDDLKRKMDCFEEINWSAIARSAFNEKVGELEFIKKFKEKSTFTEEEAVNLGRELNKRLAKRRQ